MDSVVNKASASPEVPLRAFCRKVTIRFWASPSKFKIKLLAVPKGSPDFCQGQSNCDALARVVKLICPSEQYA
jgi:hypothetical protein